jgi:hypothetical protein
MGAVMCPMRVAMCIVVCPMDAVMCTVMRPMGTALKQLKSTRVGVII